MHRKYSCNGKAVDFFSRGTRFESWTEHQLSWLYATLFTDVARQAICPNFLSLDGGTDSLFRNVGHNCQSTPRNIPEGRRPQLHRGGGNLKSHTDYTEIGLSWCFWIRAGNYRAVPRGTHDHVVPNPSQFTIYQSKLCTLTYWLHCEGDQSL